MTKPHVPVIILNCAVFVLCLVLTHTLLAGPPISNERATDYSLRTSGDHANPHRVLIGSGRVVYLRNCQSCHGLYGMGDGVFALTLRTRPSDLTTGIYKFRSTPTGALPTDEDLMRTLSSGIPTSGMPSFGGMPERDRLAVVAYVKSLSSRFTTEPAEEQLVIPPEPGLTVESVKTGQRAYERLDCASCHGAAGTGWGPLASGLNDDDGRPIRPTDLTGSCWKGGCQGQDLYRSILTGLDGTPMPSFANQLQPEEAWALVHYIQFSLDGRGFAELSSSTRAGSQSP